MHCYTSGWNLGWKMICSAVFLLKWLGVYGLIPWWHTDDSMGEKCPFWWWWPSWWQFWWQSHREEGQYLRIVYWPSFGCGWEYPVGFFPYWPTILWRCMSQRSELQRSRTWLGLYYLSQMTSTVVRNITAAYISRIYCLCSPTMIVYHQWLRPDICTSDLHVFQPQIHWC